MTWEELGEQIAGMTKKQRQAPVRVLEPYDDNAAMLEPDSLCESDGDAGEADDPVPAGECYLA